MLAQRLMYERIAGCSAIPFMDTKAAFSYSIEYLAQNPLKTNYLYYIY